MGEVAEKLLMGEERRLIGEVAAANIIIALFSNNINASSLQ